MLHAIAHIEFNAIDLAFDMAVRFESEIEALALDSNQFMDDWMAIGTEEARHFSMIERRLADMGTCYGDFPAHDGLWEAASKTNGSILGRLVVAPLILEARGLDVTPEMIKKFHAAGDEISAKLLEVIYHDEIGHVACGWRWFNAVCKVKGLDTNTAFAAMRRQFFSGALKPPFNHKARGLAGLPRGVYEQNSNVGR